MLLPATAGHPPACSVGPGAVLDGWSLSSHPCMCNTGGAQALLGNISLLPNRCIHCPDKLIKATLFFPPLIPEGLQNSSPVKGATIFTWLHHLSCCAALSFINLFTKRRIAEFVCERRGFGRASGGSDFPAGQMAVLCGQCVFVRACV